MRSERREEQKQSETKIYLWTDSHQVFQLWEWRRNLKEIHNMDTDAYINCIHGVTCIFLPVAFFHPLNIYICMYNLHILPPVHPRKHPHTRRLTLGIRENTAYIHFYKVIHGNSHMLILTITKCSQVYTNTHTHTHSSPVAHNYPERSLWLYMFWS